MFQIRFSARQLFVAIVCLGIAAGLFFAAQNANAQGPQPGGKRSPGAFACPYDCLTYQGRLTDSSGAPLNSTVSIVFHLYTAITGGSPFWTSNPRSVTPINGLFTVYLGDGSDIQQLSVGDLGLAAFIGVTVGSDSEMSPRQPLNAVVGHSDQDTGVVGSSNNGSGVMGQTNNPNTAGVFAKGSGIYGTALEILYGGIKVGGAGKDTSTPAFVHVTSAGNITNTYMTIITNTLTDNRPSAILIVTPAANYGNDLDYTVNPHPVGVYWLASINHWMIYNEDGVAMPVNKEFNVLVVTAP